MTKPKRKRIGGARGTWFTRDELRELLAAAHAEDQQAWLMLLVAYWHATRPHELVGKDGMRVFPGAEAARSYQRPTRDATRAMRRVKAV